MPFFGSRPFILFAAVILALGFTAPVARAQTGDDGAKPAAGGDAAKSGDTATGGTTSTPKRHGVEIPKQTRTYVERTPPAQREAARKQFAEANKLFEQRQVTEALVLYRKVYAKWPHPRVLFNIAVSLGFLSQPLESAQNFKKVLEYGPEPINPARYKQAVERYSELVGQLSTLRVTCNAPQAKVFVDGKPVGTAPLNSKITLGPGSHVVTATLKGKVPFNARLRLEPGGERTVNVVLQDYSDVVRFRTVDRYHWYLPTIVTAVAASALAAGAGLLVKGRGDVDDIQGDVDALTATQGRTLTFTYDTAREGRAVTMQKAGFAMLGIAGAAATAAVILWVMRKKKVRYNAAESTDTKIRF